MTTNAWARRTAAEHERAVIAEASRVVFVNRYTQDRVMAKYPAEWMARARVIPQGFESMWGPASAGPASRPASAGPRGPLRLVYTGRFYEGIRTPTTLLEALDSIHRVRPLDGRLIVEFVGGDTAAYARQAQALGLDAIVHFSGRVDPAAARARAAAADALLIIDAPSDGPSLFLPSKLVDYLPLRKPVLGLTPREGPSADLLGALGYPVVDPQDVAGIAAALEQLVDAHASGRLGPTPQHDEVSHTYDIRETTRAFARVLDEACGQA